VTDGLRRGSSSAILFAIPLIFLAAAPGPASALYYSLTTPITLECHLKSEMAEAAGDRAGAIAWAESLASLDPGSSFAMSRVALLYESGGEDMTALEWGERSLALDSLNADAAMLVGRMRLRSGEAALATQVLTPPLRQLGAMPELYALRALAHQLGKNYEAALADLRRTDVLLPDFAWIATGILSMALEDGRLEEAYPALQLALELKPEDARTLALGVLLARRMGNRVLEETLLRESALAPGGRKEDVEAYGAFLVRHGKKHEFQMLLDWAEARGLHADELRIGAGQTLLGMGKYREALVAVKPLRRGPEVVPVRARAYLGLGEERNALRVYRELVPERCLTREESLVVAYLEIRVGNRGQGIRTVELVRATPLENTRQVLAASLCYSLLGHPEEAVALIREGAARGLASPSIYEQLGSAATTLGDSLLAQWAWERLRDLGRETSESLYFMASAELAQGHTDSAIESLTRAIRLNPRNGRALLLLGELRQRRGQLEMARDILIRAAQCPETAVVGNRALARVCRSLRLDSEAREAESRARSGRPGPVSGLSFFQSR
jgi:tetratricopeptide (TPR) repeat protein